MGEEMKPYKMFLVGPDGTKTELDGIKAINTVIIEPDEIDWSHVDDVCVFTCETAKPIKGIQITSMLTGYPNKEHIRLALYSKKYRVRKKYRNKIHKFVGWEVPDNE